MQRYVVGETYFMLFLCITADDIGFGLLTIFIARCGSLVMAGHFTTYGLNLTFKERSFISLCWLPKGTVQVNFHRLYCYSL